MAARNTRKAKKINGSAKGSPYLAPTKPVLHKKTNRYGAKRVIFKDALSARSLLLASHIQ